MRHLLWKRQIYKFQPLISFGGKTDICATKNIANIKLNNLNDFITT